jgi:hypothetical protein
MVAAADQPQGGREPSWQTTVVEEFGGTTTVVFFAGGGLLLLMQPASMDAPINKLAMTFTSVSW